MKIIKNLVMGISCGVVLLFGVVSCDDNSSNNNNTGACETYDCGHGTCSESNGIASCNCDTGFSGIHCNDCEPGLTGDNCDECETGYTGDNCDECADGYVANGDLCVPDNTGNPHYGTPTIDGNITEGTGDWSSGMGADTNSEPTDWGNNSLTNLYAAFDDTNFYIGVSGSVEAANSLVVYIDIDYGSGSQGVDISSTTDNDGAFDNSVSAAITVTDTNFKADWAVGTKGMDSSNGYDDNSGWRNIGLNGADFAWEEANLISGTSGFEASISLAKLFGQEIPAGAQVAVFARLINEDGQYFSNATCPPDDAQNPATVSQVMVFDIAGTIEPVCNNDGTCDNGETVQNCPNDCATQGECGDPNVFQWEDSVIYFVLVDRFYDSDGANSPVDNANWEAQYQGGDWAGVEAKMSYLDSLGINTIWLSAPYENRNSAGSAIDPGSDSHLYSAYHGYWPSPANIDYSDINNPNPVPQVEDRFGTSNDLHSLIDSAHLNSKYVLFDYVMNHVDEESGLYQQNQSWFYKENGNIILCPPNNWNDPFYSTRCAFTSYLPAFDFYKPEVRTWSINDALWWAKEYGIDGYRLDAIKHVPQEWLTEFRTAFNNEFSSPVGGRFYLVGETYDFDSQQTIKNFIDPATKLDGQFDFPLRKQLCNTLFTRSEDFNALFTWMDGNDTFYSSDTLMSTWIGNHDIPRAIHFASGDINDCYAGSYVGNSWDPMSYAQPTGIEPYERLALAFGILLTNRGVPLIYYGDEIGMAGGGDPDNRRMMQWDNYNSSQLWLKQRLTDLIRIRNENVTLRRGYRVTISGGSDTFAYKMTGCGADQDIYVFINRGDSTASISGLPAGTYTELISNETVTGGTDQSLPARSIKIFKAQ